MRLLFGVALSLVLIAAEELEIARLECDVSLMKVNKRQCNDSLPSFKLEYHVGKCLESTTKEEFTLIQAIEQNSPIPFCHLRKILEKYFHIEHDNRDPLDKTSLHKKQLDKLINRLLQSLSRKQNNVDNNASYDILFTKKSLTYTSRTPLLCLRPQVRDMSFTSISNDRVKEINVCYPNNTCCDNLKNLVLAEFNFSGAGELLFQGMCSLETLTLTTCSVQVLHLSHLNNLTQLNLMENGLESLDLSWLPISLKFLKLKMNPVRTITDTQNRAPTFRLRELNIQKTYIETMEDIPPFPSLESLHAYLVILDQHAFSRTPNLRYLHLDMRSLEYVERFSLSSFENRSSPIVIEIQDDCIKYLGFYRCSMKESFVHNITMLSVEGHSTSSCQHVTRCSSTKPYKCNPIEDSKWTVSVDCGGLQLRELPLNILSTNISHFYLDGNNFTQVDLDRILLDSYIKVLFLNGSNIDEIKTHANSTEDSECYRNHLTELYLQKNYIIRIHPKLFLCLTELEILSLEGNRIASITYNQFKHLTRLKKVFLQKNQLRHVENSTFANLKKLEMIHMEENFLNDNSFGDVLNLSNHLGPKILNLSTNKFRSVPRILLRSRKSGTAIIRVFFDNNEIRYMSTSWTWLGVHITEMHLESNQIQLLDKSSVSNLSHVKKLFLNDNKIKFIYRDTFEPLRHLEQLYLRRNRLLNPRMWEYGFPQNFKKLTIDDTSFVCDCKYIEELLVKGKVVDILDVPNLICTTHNTNEQYEMNEYLVKHCQTPKSSTMTVSIPLGAILFIALLAALFYRYRFEAQVLLYSHFPSPLLKDPTVDETKRWDVFVAYSGADLEFVAQQLHPGLERYRTCYHDRDFVLGAFITDNIIESVRDSCCTLVVLSNAFIQSPWCQYEFKMAHMKAMQDKCRGLVVIIIEDLDTTNVDEEIAVYLRTKTYMRWGDRLFWSKLYYALPPGRNSVQNEDIPLQEYVPADNL